MAPLCRRFGHEAEDVRDIGMADADDTRIAARARADSACIVTGDFGFADVRNYPPEQYAGILVLQVPHHATTHVIEALLESVLRQEEVVRNLRGRLAIAEFGRVRLRPAIA